MKKTFFISQQKNIRTYDNVSKNTTCQGHDFTTGCLLFYLYSNEHYKVMAIEVLYPDPKAIK